MVVLHGERVQGRYVLDRKSTRLNSSHVRISYAVFCLKKKIDRPLKCQLQRGLADPARHQHRVIQVDGCSIVESELALHSPPGGAPRLRELALPLTHENPAS